MQTEHAIGYALTVAGLIGILVSFAIQKSEFDPTAFGVAIASIFLAIVGIAMALERDHDSTQPSNQSNGPKPNL